ncbi:uncharacterized protein LOC125799434 [Astyanax mexicanus]|uniref:uncharacterized protein LOC103036997 n=2 Tax=Astyanax mexicanus TaxID=7994 RepID=UPI000440EC99|nr:uncharacterized protein LOC103036997 [Astyanax mexicanus]XP_049319192.1 uncharacterized protein LOC125780673 [Astyanax mexicanus]XP_049325606.1 uncharacterized protein LOC125785665 [Astyanax mexicanus]XP_049332069.1 uncharacterized protein LOC125799434 [Astyanax mexicanus]
MLLYSIYRNTVSAVIYITSCNFVHISCILYRIERLPVGGGRGRIFNAEQEAAVVNMVLANNAIRLREIKAAVIADQGVFRNIHTVSEATIDRVLRRNHMAMKQLYRVPFQRNSEAVKEARCQYVERIMELEAEGAHHIFIYVDEAGFNLCKVRRRGRNLIGNRATITVPGQRGANITMCAAISNDGVLCHIPTIGPYNTERLIAFLNALYDILIPPQERGLLRPGMPRFVIIWDNVAFHHSRIVNEWFAVHCRMMVQFLPPYSPFLNPIEEFFSAWRWKVYNHRPYEQMPLLNAMTAAAQDIDAEACQGWIRHARRFFPRCIARENIECDVDEALWPRLQERGD